MNEIEQKLPDVAISYFMDNQYLPYGELSEQQLLARLESIVEFMQATVKPSLFVIACNTASTQSLDFLRRRFDQTFVGVVPAIKPAAAASKNGHIGVLATPATANGDYIEQLIGQFASGCIVHKLGSSALVHLAEQHFWQNSVTVQSIDLEPLMQADTIVLGCTHFPLIKSQIAQMLPQGIKLVDSGRAIANRVASLLEGEGRSNKVKQLYASLSLTQRQQVILSQMGFDSISQVTC